MSTFGYPTDMQMDVRDMSYFADESFDTVIDKGMLRPNYLLFCSPALFFLFRGDIMCSVSGTLDSLMVRSVS